MVEKSNSSVLRSRRTMDAARSISPSVSASRGWTIRAACQILLAGVVAVAVVLGVTVPAATVASAAPQTSDDGVTCPAHLAGVPFASDVQFAGTSRPLAN